MLVKQALDNPSKSEFACHLRPCSSSSIATACAALAQLLWGRRWIQLPIFWLAAFAAA